MPATRTRPTPAEPAVVDVLVQQSGMTDEEIDQMVVDVLVTAIESGAYGTFLYAGPANEPGQPWSIQLGDALNGGEQVAVEAKDPEGLDEDEQTATFGRPALLAGIVGMAAFRGWTLRDFHDQHDVVDADAAVQLAVWGDIVIG